MRSCSSATLLRLAEARPFTIGFTPLLKPPPYYQRYDQQDDNSDGFSEVVKSMLSCSEAKGLSLINGASDAPLHSMIAAHKSPLVKLLLDQNTELLYRENATGRTPFGLAHDHYTALKLKDLLAGVG